MAKQQLWKRFTTGQVQDIIEKYIAKQLRAKEACRFLGVSRTQFHTLTLTVAYRSSPDTFTLSYHRKEATNSLKLPIKEHILLELSFEKTHIIENPGVPTTRYNYSYIKTLMQEKYHEQVSLPTVITLAKKNDFWHEKRDKKRTHTRQVLTNFTGELIQHDSSHHLFAPDALRKWYLITSLDDYSRKLLSARLVRTETVFMHMQAVRDVCLKFGIPFSYYVDQHSIFRYVHDRDKFSVWTTYTKFTGDVDTQWATLLKELTVKPIYALSAPAKGKIERPYQWLQDHLVRTCVRHGTTDIAEGQKILDEEVHLYNTRWVHSTTGEIPDIRFNRALKEEKTLFRPFAIPQPFESTKDIFALRQQRRTNGYRRVSLYGASIPVPKAECYMTVDIRLSPGIQADTIDLRFWSNSQFLGTQTIASKILPDVHF